MSIFHPDMFWPWLKDEQSHNPVDWVLELDRYNYQRWKNGWQESDTMKLFRHK